MKPEDIPEDVVDAGIGGFLDATDMDTPTDVYVRAVLAAAWPLIAKAERERIARWHEAAAAKIDAVRATEGPDKIPVVWSRHHCYDAAAIRALEDTPP